MNTRGMRRVGRGQFSTVYMKDRNTVLIKSCCRVKEAMSYGAFPSCTLFPEIRHVGNCEHGYYRFYEERYYEKVKAPKQMLSAREYEFYRELVDIYETYWRTRGSIYLGLDLIPNKFRQKREQLLEALCGLYGYGISEPRFEISPRNIAVSRGRLVLLDCFFTREK